MGIGSRAHRQRRIREKSSSPGVEGGNRVRRETLSTSFLDVFPTPGFLEERMHILLAKGLTAGERAERQDAKIISHAYTVDQLKRMIKGGKLRDGKSIAGILYTLHFLGKVARSPRRAFCVPLTGLIVKTV